VPRSFGGILFSASYSSNECKAWGGEGVEKLIGTMKCENVDGLKKRRRNEGVGN
jgi:hypothetical protein